MSQAKQLFWKQRLRSTAKRGSDAGRESTHPHLGEHTQVKRNSGPMLGLNAWSRSGMESGFSPAGQSPPGSESKNLVFIGASPLPLTTPPTPHPRDPAPCSTLLSTLLFAGLPSGTWNREQSAYLCPIHVTSSPRLSRLGVKSPLLGTTHGPYREPGCL